MTTPNEYGAICGCTCKAQTVLRLWDERGTFTVEHTHAPTCAKELNKAQWHARHAGVAEPDLTTRAERRQRRIDSAFVQPQTRAEYENRPPPWPTQDQRAPDCEHGWDGRWGKVGERQAFCGKCRRYVWEHNWSDTFPASSLSVPKEPTP